jgi:hypothetical protein
MNYVIGYNVFKSIYNLLKTSSLKKYMEQKTRLKNVKRA